LANLVAVIGLSVIVIFNNTAVKCYCVFKWKADVGFEMSDD